MMASEHAEVIGEIFFTDEVRLEVAEALSFDQRRIEDYGYTIYRGEEKLYWYDSQPHPNDSSLAGTHPHHKHVPPNIKHNRVPAPDLSFTQPNLPLLIKEILSSVVSNESADESDD